MLAASHLFQSMASLHASSLQVRAGEGPVLRQFFINWSNPEATRYFVAAITNATAVPGVDATFTDDSPGVPAEHPELQVRVERGNGASERRVGRVRSHFVYICVRSCFIFYFFIIFCRVGLVFSVMLYSQILRQVCRTTTVYLPLIATLSADAQRQQRHTARAATRDTGEVLL